MSQNKGAARQAAQLVQQLKRRADNPHGKPRRGSIHIHHDPHLPAGLEPGDWQKYLHKFEETGATIVSDQDVVRRWNVLTVAAWIASVNDNDFEQYADNFLEHHIDGSALLRLTSEHLDEIGINRVSDRVKLTDVLAQMQRRCKKPETQNITVPSWLSCYLQMFRFDWADTSEGKSGAEIQEELVQANGSIAMVSTLTWAMAWDLLFGSANACFCPADPTGYFDPARLTDCWCSTAWDLEGRPLSVFYCFSGLSAIFFMLSTIFAVVQILMVYEMSDDEEVETFMDLLKRDAQLPGRFLSMGMMCFFVPIGTYIIYTHNLGLVPGPSDSTQRAFGWLAALFTLGVTLMGFFYQIPSMIRGVYQAKLNVMQRDRQPLWVTWTASQE